MIFESFQEMPALTLCGRLMNENLFKFSLQPANNRLFSKRIFKKRNCHQQTVEGALVLEKTEVENAEKGDFSYFYLFFFTFYFYFFREFKMRRRSKKRGNNY